MSISSEITRLQNAKADIKSSIEEKGVTVPSTATLDDYSELIDSIPAGGGDIDWSAIGFDGMPQGIQDGYDYAIEVKNNWNSSTTSLSYKFYNNYNLMFMPLVDTSNATSANNMFYGCKSLIKVADLNFNSVTGQNLESLFDGCNSLTNIGEIKVSNITSIKACFRDCAKLKSIPQLNTSNVTNMQNAFSNCISLTTIPQLNTSNVTNMQNAFSNCISLTTIPQLNTSNVTNMQGAFSNCSSLTSIPQLNTNNVIYMNQLFSSCVNLIDLPQLNTSKVTNMTGMFQSCRNLSNNSLDNVLLMCINATSYTGTKTLTQLGFQAAFTPAYKLQALPHYQDFLDAGWTIGY